MPKPDRQTLLQRRQRRRAVWRRFFVSIFLICLAGGTLYLFYFFASLGPRSVDPRTIQAASTDVSDSARRLLELSEDAEARLDELLSLRPADDEHLALLREALDYQRAFVEALPRVDGAASARLDALELRFHTMGAELLFQQSVELENEADRLLVQREFGESAPYFSRAAALQQAINNEYPRSPLASRSRETRLTRSARFTTARPLHEESLALEATGEAAFDAGDWEDAETALRAALRIQDQINREFFGSSLASVPRAETLRSKINGIQSGQDYQAIRKTLEQAEERRAEGNLMEAAALYQEARRLQIQLNDRFPNSPHASQEAVTRFEIERQTLQSEELASEIVRKRKQLSDFLRNRELAAVPSLITSIREDLQTLARSYPRSRHNDERLQLEMRYLSLIPDAIDGIHERVYANLQTVPETEGLQMLITEVPQALYEAVMAVNPSRRQGQELPVESVSWNEANEFCMRLSWILGRTVRLPTEMEFRQALGPLRFLTLEDHAWGAENSDRLIQAVRTRQAHTDGFFDLLGNVAEWLHQPEEANGRVSLVENIGGNVNDSFNQLFTVPLRQSPPNERNRHIGFRFVIEAGE